MRGWRGCLLVLSAALVMACSGGEEPGKAAPQKKTAALVEYRFAWYAICRCKGGLCSSEGRYEGRHGKEEEAVAAMKTQVNKQLGCDSETFLKFDYEKR